MRDKTTIERPEHYRVLLLIEQLQRQGKTEAEIADAVREATTRSKQSGGAHQGRRRGVIRHVRGPIPRPGRKLELVTAGPGRFLGRRVICGAAPDVLAGFEADRNGALSARQHRRRPAASLSRPAVSRCRASLSSPARSRAVRGSGGCRRKRRPAGSGTRALQPGSPGRRPSRGRFRGAASEAASNRPRGTRSPSRSRSSPSPHRRSPRRTRPRRPRASRERRPVRPQACRQARRGQSPRSPLRSARSGRGLRVR